MGFFVRRKCNHLISSYVSYNYKKGKFCLVKEKTFYFRGGFLCSIFRIYVYRNIAYKVIMNLHPS